MKIIGLAFLCACAVAAPVAEAGVVGGGGAIRGGIVGTWLNQERDARIEIRPGRGRPGRGGLAGKIVWLEEPFDEDSGEPRRDEKNPDPELRHRGIVGLEILSNFSPEPDSDGRWTGGTVYDPKSGKTYSGYLVLESEDRLKLRGYFGIPLFGRTARWTRVPFSRSSDTPADPAPR